jgi:N-acyl-L-homoserine lactone synthetase
MIISRTLSVVVNGNTEKVLFGIPDTEDEKDKMFRLRYSEYSRREYIDSEKFSNQSEQDEYDIDGTSVYFIAMWRDVVVGTIRLIQKDHLPTESAFEFTEPQLLSKVPRSQRAEFGRFIIVPLDRSRGIYLPRGLVMMVMFDVLLQYCIEHNLKGGYSFIKTSLYKKMSRLKFPIHIISPYTQVYPEDGVLYKYFSQKNDPVLPIAFLTDDFAVYFGKKLSNKFLFKKNGRDIIMRDTIYTHIMKLLRII